MHYVKTARLGYGCEYIGKVALPIEDKERNLTKSILARVCTLNVCGYSTL